MLHTCSAPGFDNDGWSRIVQGLFTVDSHNSTDVCYLEKVSLTHAGLRNFLSNTTKGGITLPDALQQATTVMFVLLPLRMQETCLDTTGAITEAFAFHPC